MVGDVGSDKILSGLERILLRLDRILSDYGQSWTEFFGVGQSFSGTDTILSGYSLGQAAFC